MYYNTRGMAKTEAERIATHNQLYNTPPPAQRQGRNAYNTRGLGRTEAERIATHNQLYNTPPPAQRLRRNAVSPLAVGDTAESNIAGAVQFAGAIAVVYALYEIVLPLIKGD